MQDIIYKGFPKVSVSLFVITVFCDERYRACCVVLSDCRNSMLRGAKVSEYFTPDRCINSTQSVEESLFYTAAVRRLTYFFYVNPSVSIYIISFTQNLSL